MKRITLLAFLVLGTTMASFSNEPLSNEPTSIDGSYVTVNSFEYSFETGEWYDLDTAYQILSISSADGNIKLGEDSYSIVKMKKKYNKKTNSMNFEFNLLDAAGERSTAIFISYEKDELGETKYAQFYLSNIESEVSFDLKVKSLSI
jgi:hypothetical protein